MTLRFMTIASVIFIELILLELILGLSNVWLANSLSEKLPPNTRNKARTLGLSFAWLTRVLALVFYSFTADYHFTVKETHVYWADLLLLVGGIWLLLHSIQELLFRHRAARSSSSNLTTVLLQNAFVSTVLSVDAIRTASAYIDNDWIASAITLLTMVVSPFLSRRIIQLFQVQTKGLVLLLFSTGLLLALEALHTSIVVELICFGAALYLMNSFVLPRFGNYTERNKPICDEHQ